MKEWGGPGFSMERKGEVVNRAAEEGPAGGGRREWRHRDEEREREGRRGTRMRGGNHGTDSVLRYATMLRDCYAIWFGKEWEGYLAASPFSFQLDRCLSRFGILPLSPAIIYAEEGRSFCSRVNWSGVCTRGGKSLALMALFCWMV